MDGPMAGRNVCDAYCELHAHSNFSFLDGASHPEDLVARAALLEMPALAITDHAGMYAAVRLWKATQQTATPAARDAGLVPASPIIGVELAIPRDRRELRAARRGRRLNDPIRGPNAVPGWTAEAPPRMLTTGGHRAAAGGRGPQAWLVGIRPGPSLDEARELLLPNAEYRVKPGRELAVIGASLPDAKARRAWTDGIARAGAIGQA